VTQFPDVFLSLSLQLRNEKGWFDWMRRHRNSFAEAIERKSWSVMNCGFDVDAKAQKLKAH
jgi:hypothetical protein